MAVDVWLVFVATVLVFMLTPGPSHILMLSNSITNGFSKASATAVGDLSANFLQMLAASLGLASVLYSAENTFLIINLWFRKKYFNHFRSDLIYRLLLPLRLTIFID